MMLEYDFNKFQEVLKTHQTAIAKKAPFIHYYKDSKIVLITFRNDEGSDIYTVVPTSRIEEFGQHYDVDTETAMEHFFVNYLSNAIRLSSDPRYTLPEEIVAEEPEEEYYVDLPVIDEEAITKVFTQGEAEEKYTDFLKKLWLYWEKNTINAINKLDKSYMNKGFTDFLQGLFGGLGTNQLLGKLQVFIKQGMKAGLSSAEEDAGQDIGFTLSMENRVKSLEYEQLNGYSMVNGERWHGIKGASSDLQSKILDVVSEGLKDKKSHTEVAKDIQGVFDVSKSRAEAIAVTETTRFYNEAKQLGFEEIGMRFKKPQAVMDSKTSDLCKRLHKKYSDKGVLTSEKYIDDVSGASFMHPPHHVRCRCYIEGSMK